MREGKTEYVRVQRRQVDRRGRGRPRCHGNFPDLSTGNMIYVVIFTVTVVIWRHVYKTSAAAVLVRSPKGRE